MDRSEALHLIAARILALAAPHPLRVGIDGVTAAGKTTLADELAEAMRDSGRQIIRASLDDFHNPPEMRYRRGRDSPEGYYHDAVDYASVRDLLLAPLAPAGSRRYRIGGLGQPDGVAARFDDRLAGEDAIALIDGVFLFRPELNDCWDYRVFIEVDPANAIERGIERDAGWMGGPETTRRRYMVRYVPGERIYLDAVRPWELADVLLQNDTPLSPSLWFREP